MWLVFILSLILLRAIGRFFYHQSPRKKALAFWGQMHSDTTLCKSRYGSAWITGRCVPKDGWSRPKNKKGSKTEVKQVGYYHWLIWDGQIWPSGLSSASKPWGVLKLLSVGAPIFLPWFFLSFLCCRPTSQAEVWELIMFKMVETEHRKVPYISWKLSLLSSKYSIEKERLASEQSSLSDTTYLPFHRLFIPHFPAAAPPHEACQWSLLSAVTA